MKRFDFELIYFTSISYVDVTTHIKKVRTYANSKVDAINKLIRQYKGKPYFATVDKLREIKHTNLEKSNSNTCVVCGTEIPEGTQVCKYHIKES